MTEVLCSLDPESCLCSSVTLRGSAQHVARCGMTVLMYIPNQSEFLAAVRMYDQRELRGQAYFEALERIRQGWGDPVSVEGGIRYLLRRWHMNFYRFGMYQEEAVQECLSRNAITVNAFRGRSIESLGQADNETICAAFCEFMTALRGGKNRQQDSPVATAKALHLLAPGFLPLWDNDIAWAYGHALMFPMQYVTFCQQMKVFAAAVAGYIAPDDDRTLLKRIDEFNYSVYTKHWAEIDRN